jgi:hypothetical protein
MEAKKRSFVDNILLISQVLILVASLAGALYAADQMAVFEIGLQKDGFVRGSVFASPAFFYIANTVFALAAIAAFVLGIVFMARHKGIKSFLFLWALGVGGYLPVLARDLSYAFTSGTSVLFILLMAVLSAAVVLFALASTRLFKAKTDSTLVTVGAICLAVLSVYFLVKAIDQENAELSSGLIGLLHWPLYLAFSISVFAASVFVSVYLWLVYAAQIKAALPSVSPPLKAELPQVEPLAAQENEMEPTQVEPPAPQENEIKK